MNKLTLALCLYAVSASVMAKAPSPELKNDIADIAVAASMCPYSKYGETRCKEKVEDIIERKVLADGFSYSTAKICSKFLWSDYDARKCNIAMRDD